MEKQLIDFVRENRFLYDKKHVLYRNQLQKDKKWKDFSKEVNVPVDSVKKRWKSMRDRFYRVCKTNSSMPSGNGQNTPNKKAYKFYESLQFLCDVDTSKMRTTDNIAVVNMAEESSSHIEESFDMDEACCSAFSLSETLSSAPATVPQKRKHHDDVQNELLNVLKTMISSAAQNLTPFRTFLESVALTVESANCSLAQLTCLQVKILQLVQHEIQNNTT